MFYAIDLIFILKYMVGEVVISTQMETEYSALRRNSKFPTGIICIWSAIYGLRAQVELK